MSHKSHPICAFSRRLSTEERIFRLSRYLATVRRAISILTSFSLATIASSDRMSSGVLPIDHVPDAEAHRFGRMGVAAIVRSDRGGEKIFQLEQAARRRHVFVGGDARDGRFMHADRLGDGLEVERAQMFDAMAERRRPADARFRSKPSKSCGLAARDFSSANWRSADRST